MEAVVLYPALFEPVKALVPADGEVRLQFVPYEISDVVRQARRADPRTPHPDEPPVSDELRDALQSADAVLCLDAPRDIPKLSSRVRWVQALGSGVEQFRVSLDAKAGITMTNGAGLGSDAIAEWVVGRVLENYKRFADHRALQEQKVWERCFGRPLRGARVLIVGTGAIGVACAERLAVFGVELHGVRADPSKGTGHPTITKVWGAGELLDALGWADIVVLAASSNAAGAMIGSTELSAMKPGALFVNVARGSMVDEPALIEAVRSGHLGGAALDVVSTEPLPATAELWTVPNVVISPHSSVSQAGYFTAGAQLFCDNAALFIAGQPLKNVVDIRTW